MKRPGIQINYKNLGSTPTYEYTVNTLFAGGMKVHNIYEFINDRSGLTKISNIANLSVYIQQEPHELGFTPAYIAYKGYQSPTGIDYIAMADEDFVSVGGNGDFVNVTDENVIVGFDIPPLGADFMKVVVFAESLDKV